MPVRRPVISSTVLALLVAVATAWPDDRARAQAQTDDALVVRSAPPALDDFETDANDDGVPDGWYNLRDARIMTEGGAVGRRFLRFECAKPGRPARLSRAFGVDGSRYEAIVLGLWVRHEYSQLGERLGEEPGLVIDFLGDQLRQITRGSLGPWTARTMSGHTGWTRVARRIPVPRGTRDAILSLGLLGATGRLDVDGLTVDLVPIGGESTTNLVRNGDLELGDPSPAGWICDNGARRGFPGYRSRSALELGRAGARALVGLALPVDRFPALSITVLARGQGLRGGGGASGHVFFVDDDGRPLPGLETGIRAFGWAGTFDWRDDHALIRVPNGASHAVFQLEKSDGLGTVRIDDLEISAVPDATAGTWKPYHVAPETGGWPAIAASTAITPGSALDFSFLLDGPAGRFGPVKATEGHLHFTRGGNRARFLGVQLLPPAAYRSREAADALAERLARSGINLVRLGDLDTPLGPERSLFDDSFDNTDHLDAVALARLDHLAAALKARGVYFALEIQGARQFRADDGVPLPGTLPPGGGPAAVFDPRLAKKAENAARLLLSHVNPETGVAWKDEPALAWVTLAGEVTLFDLIGNPNLLSSDYSKPLRELSTKSGERNGRRFWQSLEEAHWKGLADALRKDGLVAPIASASHWRREREFADALAGPGLDLIDDRIFWAGPTWVSPRYRSMLWDLDGSLIAEAARKRKAGRPYVLGQWCDLTQGVWASPFEAAEQLLAARSAAVEDWDGLVRRGVFVYPEAWGSAPPGTVGGEDIFQIPEVANAEPHVFGLWPHQASLLLRGAQAGRSRAEAAATVRGRKVPVPGWEPERGRLVIDTPFTQGVAGWPSGEAVKTEALVVEVENSYATVVASAVGDEPISRAGRLLVTAMARIVPTDFAYADEWRREAANPGRPPLLKEPVGARVLWKRKGTVKGYALDNDGKRIGPARVEADNDGALLTIEGSRPSLHWELVVE